ncbi:hypothetical protein OICFNHDK_4174 [Methylobacterium bullatum]|uniref:Uncharacterized protein n=1 Tax=Methylobacterium bullatum TaxID=570505 RepID=A0AAV4ZCC2_9HYPH|nr:hypothetical protein OICFNHDK_4174 [Methylobacterium bullatum]
MLLAMSSDDPAPTWVMILPPVPKLVSRLPFALYRTTAKSSPVPLPRAWPATTILPSAWSVTLWPWSSNALATEVRILPVPFGPKLVSRLPSAL